MRATYRGLGFAMLSFCLYLSGQGVAYAACPPIPTSPNQTVTVLTQCCGWTLDPLRCGYKVNRPYIRVTPPSISTTSDPGNPNIIAITVNHGGWTTGDIGACTGANCWYGHPWYIMTPFLDEYTYAASPSTFYNYPSSAWVGDRYHVDKTKLPANKCSVDFTWSGAGIPSHKVSYPIGPCVPTQPKPQPKPRMDKCNASNVPSSVKCGQSSPDPVDPYSGDYYYSEADLEVPGIVPLRAVRSYTSSLNSFIGPFGIGTYLEGYNYKITPAINPDGTVNISANQTVLFDEGSGIAVPFSNDNAGGLTFKNTSSIGPAGSTLTLALDDSNHLAGATYTTPDKTVFTFNADGLLIQTRDFAGNTVTMSRDNSGKLQTVSSLGRSLAFTYNGDGLIQQIEDHSGRKYQYQYDADKQLVAIVNPDNEIQSYTWYPEHRIQTMEDYADYTRFLNYYFDNGMFKQQVLINGTSVAEAEVWKLDFTGSLTRVLTDPNGYTRTLTYNSQGLLTQDTDALNHTTTFTYSPSLFDGSPTNRYIEKTDALNDTTRWDLDGNNQLVSVTDPLNHSTSIVYNATWPTKPASVTDAMSRTYHYTYDSAGNLSQMEDPDNKITAFTYNGHGQPLTVTNALNKTTTLTYGSDGDLLTVTDPLNHTTTMTYDSLGRRISLTDPRNQTTSFEYTVFNDLKKTTNALNGVTEYAYSATRFLTGVKNPRGYNYTFNRDRKGRLTRLLRPTGLSSFGYDDNDRLTAYTDFKGQRHEYTYDNANRLTQERVRVGSAWQDTYAYTYDAADRLSNIQKDLDNWAFTYDAADRLSSVVSPQGSTSYTYDADNNRTSLTATGQPLTGYNYDVLNRLTGITQGTKTYGFMYDSIGRRTSLTRPNGVTTTYTYDDSNQLSRIQHEKPGVLNEQHDYSYDPNGNILSSSTAGNTRTYSYDALNRLTQMVKTPVPGEPLPKQIDWLFDANSNIIQRKDTDDSNSSTTFDYSYDSNDFMTQRTTNGGSPVTFTYDANGSLTSDGTRTFTWNGMNQLSQMTANGATTSFAYDPLGRRTQLSRGSLNKTYLYDGYDLLSDGSSQFLYGAGIDEPLQIVHGSVTGSYLADRINSITRITDTAGGTMGQYSYHPYGAQLSSSLAMTENPLTYTAREDDGNGLMYYRARYYDPELEVFISQDPLGDAQRYVGGNPLSFIDPLGLWGGGVTVGASVEVGVVAGAGATGSVGYGVYGGGGKGVNTGGTASGGAFVGVPGFGPCTSGRNKGQGAVGAFAGLGVGAFITNAKSASDLSGYGNTTSLNIGFGPAKFGAQYTHGANGIGSLGVTFGPGGAFSISNYGTTTVTTK